MNTIEIKCHSCGTTIELTKTLAAPLLDSQRQEYEQKIALREQAQKQRETEVAQREEKLSHQEAEIDKRVKQQLGDKIEQEKKDFSRKHSLEINSLNQRLEEKNNEISQAQKIELEMRKARDEAVLQKERSELEVKRQVDTQLADVREKAISQASESANKKISEQDQILDGLRKQISDMERKADPTAAHLHGNIQEESVVSKLQLEFPQDTFERVTKGARGADIRQQVKLPNGRTVGTIIIEVKNTQNWDGNWIPKLKDDQRVAGADIPVIVSRTLPRNINSFEQIDNVWVCAVPVLLPMMSCLRNGIISVAREKSANAVSADRKEQIFQYLKSNSFSMRISGIIEAYDTMRVELDKEKKTQHNYWAKREISLNRMLQGISGLSGDFQQLGGPEVLEGKNDELEAIEEAEQPVAAIKVVPNTEITETTPEPILGTVTTEPSHNLQRVSIDEATRDNEADATLASAFPEISPPIGTATSTDEVLLNILEVLVRVGQSVTERTPIVSVLDTTGQVRMINSAKLGKIQSIKIKSGEQLTEVAVINGIEIE